MSITFPIQDSGNTYDTFAEYAHACADRWTDPERSLTDYISQVTDSSHNAQQKRYDNSSGGRRD